MRPHPEELLAVAVAAARAAGEVVLDGLAHPRAVEHKTARTSIVTWVDRVAQDEVVRVIAAHFPDHAVRAEEGLHDVASGRLTWLVDPLDGTSNYSHGIPFACTSVAVADDDGAIAGAVLEPFRGELFTVTRGGGAWLGDRRLSVSTTSSLDQALVCTGVQSDDPAAIADFGRRIIALCTHCRGVRCIGSPALGLAYVAAGRFDAFVERDSTYAWDVGASGLLITESGGRAEDLDGGPLNLGPGVANVLASNGLLHEALQAVVR